MSRRSNSSSKNKFTKSEVINESGTRANTTTRHSRSTVPPRDAVIRCIEDRALSFQGLVDTKAHRSRLEPLQLVAYDDVGENYQFHTDWFGLPSQTTDEYGGDRLSSFFVYVTVTEDLTGGGTNFPLLDAPADTDPDGRWCRYVNCDEPWDNGVTFRPVARNAVFWRNLRGDDDGGSGDRRTLHAGLPVTSGSKMGMNIWTRERASVPL
ncbi:hypothetical protein VTN00DRAFT_8867 [Thermoascus crustaceus]|uniref:uncharacterized protein n=1 Tax=Thermoascus crustaceus TaxID=5088 RepID=UPI003744987B